MVRHRSLRQRACSRSHPEDSPSVATRQLLQSGRIELRLYDCGSLVRDNGTVLNGMSGPPGRVGLARSVNRFGRAPEVIAHEAGVRTAVAGPAGSSRYAARLWALQTVSPYDFSAGRTWYAGTAPGHEP